MKNSNYFKFPFIFFAVSFHFFRINQVVTIVSLNCLEQFKLHVFNRLIFLMILFYLAWIWHTQYKHVYSITLSMYYIYNCRFRFILICLKLSRFKILSDIIRRVLNIYASVKVSWVFIINTIIKATSLFWKLYCDRKLKLHLVTSTFRLDTGLAKTMEQGAIPLMSPDSQVNMWMWIWRMRNSIYSLDCATASASFRNETRKGFTGSQVD